MCSNRKTARAVSATAKSQAKSKSATRQEIEAAHHKASLKRALLARAGHFFCEWTGGLCRMIRVAAKPRRIFLILRYLSFHIKARPSLLWKAVTALPNGRRHDTSDSDLMLGPADGRRFDEAGFRQSSQETPSTWQVSRALLESWTLLGRGELKNDLPPWHYLLSFL